MAAQFSMSEPTNSKSSLKTPDLERIEAEYIKNLQQQIYFLELEANYLREQVRKSTELQPKMTAEAKRMIVKLKDLQKALEGTRLGMKHKDSEVEVSKLEKERLLGKLRADEDSHQRERQLLLDEIAQLKSEKALLDRSIANKDVNIAETEHRLEICQSSARTAENKLRLFETQLSQKSDQLRLVQQTVDEKRVELLRAEEKLHQSEERYYSSSALGHDKVKEDLREEVRLLRKKLKEMETMASHDKSLRSKMSDEGGHALRENARLHQQVREFESQLDMVMNSTATSNLDFSSGSGDHRRWEQDVQAELQDVKEQLKHEQDRLGQLLRQEQMVKKQQLSLTTAQSSLAEMAARHEKLEEEGQELRTEKEVLFEHVTDLQRQVDEKQEKINDLEGHVHSLEDKLKNLEHLQGLHSSIQSQKWEEFGRLAESMKALSEKMARSSSPKPRLSKSNSHD